MAIKYRGEEHRQQIKQQFAEASEVIENPTSLEQSFSDLKKMTKEELIDRLEQVENQAILIKWRIWWEIRQKFPSDKLFGQYVAKLRNDPTHANCVGSQQDINRALNAGRFCEKHRINDLRKIGVPQSSIYALSRPANDDIAGGIYKAVKGKGYPVAEIEHRIAQAKAVSTVPHIATQATQPMDYDHPLIPRNDQPREPYTIEVVKNVAQIEAHNNYRQVDIEEELPEVAELAARHEAVAIMRENIEVESKATDEDIVSAILNFVAWYKLSPMKLISILQLAIKRIQTETYRSQA